MPPVPQPQKVAPQVGPNREENKVKEPKQPEQPEKPREKTPRAPGTDELLDQTGTLTLNGQTFAVSVVMRMVDAADKDATVNLWKLLKDLAALNAGILGHDTDGAGNALYDILADLGIPLTRAQLTAVVERLTRSAATGGGAAVAPALAGEVESARKKE